MRFCWLFFVLLGFPLFSAQPALREVIDFKKSSNQFAEYSSPKLLALSDAFNGAPELSSFFRYLKRQYQIDTVVETGTFRGATTTLFSQIFKRVYTIEVSESLFRGATYMFSGSQNVRCHLGNSEEVLNRILPTLADRAIIFYLDAHWEDYWPLLGELEEIAKTHRDNCIIVIDDIQVPGRSDIPHDFYGDKYCSHEYVRPALKKVFSKYSVHYVIPKSVHARAKLVAIPMNWQ